MLAAQISINNLHANTLELYYGHLKECGIDILLISCCEFFQEGDERARTLDRMKNAIRYYEDRGFEVIVWTSSLGYGGVRGEDFHRMFPSFTGLTDFDGHSGDAVCALDENYTEYMKHNVRDFIQAGAKTILWDDDLVQSVRPGLVCCCEKHLRLFEEKTGRKITPKDCEKLFTGKPSAARTAYLDIMGDSLNGFCRAVREAADALDPSVNMGICASFTHYDIDGAHFGDTVRILAGKDRTPLLRLSGAPYWASFAPRYKGNTLSGVLEFVKMQHGWYADQGMTVMDENDCYPHDDRLVPAAYSELYDKITLTLPGLIRHKYILCFAPDSGCRRYMNEHIHNIGDDKKIISLLSGLSPCGLRVYHAEHLLRDAVLPDEYPGNGKMFADFTQPFDGIFAALNSVPTKYTGTGAGIVFGDSARALTEEQLSQGLILDMKAAMILKERGVDTGFISAERLNENPHKEIFGDQTENFDEPDGVFYRAELQESARVCSTFGAGGEILPACWTYEDGSGRKFAVYAFEGTTLTYSTNGGSPGAVYSVHRQKQLAYLYNVLSGKALPLLITGQPGLYVQALSSEDSKEAAFVLCNISPDALRDARAETGGRCELLGQLYDGQWSDENSQLHCASLPPYSYTTIRIRRM